MTRNLLSRRCVLTGAAGLSAAAILSRSSLADWKPTETIRVIVPAAAGGSTDVVGRALEVAEGVAMCLDVVAASRRAIVVFPLPAGPHRMAEPTRSDSARTRRGAPGSPCGSVPPRSGDANPSATHSETLPARSTMPSGVRSRGCPPPAHVAGSLPRARVVPSPHVGGDC